MLVLSDITETVLKPTLATKTSPLTESYATPMGPDCTGMVATTALVLSDITETVLEPKFVTKTSPLAES